MLGQKTHGSLIKRKLLSVYELDEHPDYDYCYGDVVVRLAPVPVASDTPTYRDPTKEQVQHAVPVQANGDQGSRMLPGCKLVEHRSQDDTDVNFSGLSWVGNITGLQDGDIEVTWVDGMVSKVYSLSFNGSGYCFNHSFKNFRRRK